MKHDNPTLDNLIKALEVQLDEIRKKYPEHNVSHLTYAYIYIGAAVGFDACSDGPGPVLACAWHALTAAQVADDNRSDSFLVLDSDGEYYDA